jgi:hypothetical protein
MFVLGIIGVAMILYGAYALFWDAWKARRVVSRVSICIFGLVIIAIGYFLTSLAYYSYLPA